MPDRSLSLSRLARSAAGGGGCSSLRRGPESPLDLLRGEVEGLYG